MPIIKLHHNQVWRTYIGGKRIGEFYNEAQPLDNHYPEVWIASMTKAFNPTFVENEGLSLIEGNNITLSDFI